MIAKLRKKKLMQLTCTVYPVPRREIRLAMRCNGVFVAYSFVLLFRR